MDVYHWHGPGVVCLTEPPANLDLSLLDRCYWVVHGSALIRCTHEQLRPETVDERDYRESVTETHMPAPNLDTIRGLLLKVKGPVWFVDLKSKERPYRHAPPPPAQPQKVYEPTEAEQRAAAHAARKHHQATAPIPFVPEDTPAVNETAPEPSAPENISGTKETTPSQFGPVDGPMDTGLPEWLQPFEPEETDAGLHVDDFVGGGEGMSHVAVKGWNHVPVGVPSFASRVKWLKTKLELGSIHLGLSFPFTGIQLTQSSDFECIHLSLENYLQKVKPIALSKERRQNPHAETTAQEKH